MKAPLLVIMLSAYFAAVNGVKCPAIARPDRACTFGGWLILPGDVQNLTDPCVQVRCTKGGEDIVVVGCPAGGPPEGSSGSEYPGCCRRCS